MEGISHLSLIFCLVINIVIFTSQTGGEWLESDESNEFGPFVNREDASSEYANNRFNFKARRTVPNSFESDDGEKDLSFGDANIRYILDHMETPDVNGQAATATAKPETHTFNGKLIRCFIHRCLRSFSPSPHIESKIYCFVFLRLLSTPPATVHNSHRSSQQQQQS